MLIFLGKDLKQIFYNYYFCWIFLSDVFGKESQLLEAVPIHLYKPKFDLECFSYSADARRQIQYTEIFKKLKALKKPLVFIITQREGSHLSLAREHPLYLRMDIIGGKLQLMSTVDAYASGGQVWDDDVLAVHISMPNTFFFAGTVNAGVNERLPSSFIEDFQKEVGVKDLPVKAVVLAGVWKDLQWFCNPNSPRGSHSNGRVRHNDKVSRLRDLAGSQFENLVRGFRATSKECEEVELIVVGGGSKGNYVPGNPNCGGSRVTTEVTSSMKLNDVNEGHFEAMVGYFMTFLEEVRERHRNPSPNRPPVLWTSSPLDRGVHQFFSNDGGLLPSYREAYTLALCNAVFRGYGYRRLGVDGFESVYLRACAGQFQYLIDEVTIEGRPYTSVACLSPLIYHQHSGVPCLLNHRLFQGTADRNLIQTAEVIPSFVSIVFS